MQRARTILMLGVWVAVLPYLGFPTSWKNIFFTLTGLGLAYFAYILYKEYKIRTGGSSPKTFDNFSENQGFRASMNEMKKDGNKEPLNN